MCEWDDGNYYIDEYGIARPVNPAGYGVPGNYMAPGSYVPEEYMPNGYMVPSINVVQTNYQVQSNAQSNQEAKENPYFNMDYGLMTKLGFGMNEMRFLQWVVSENGYVSNQTFTRAPFFVDNQVSIARLMYAYNICMGKKVIDTGDIRSIAQHFKKLNSIMGGTNEVDCRVMTDKQIRKVPRIAVVGGLPEGAFSVLNSVPYGLVEGSYEVLSVAQEWVTIQSDRRMGLTRSDRLNPKSDVKEYGIPGVLKVKQIGNRDAGVPWIIQIHKKHCRLCNRFVVVATTKYAERVVNHGGYRMVLANGRMISIYVKTIEQDAYGNPKETVPNGTKDTAILDYGLFTNEIKWKLDESVIYIQEKFQTVYAETMGDEEPFEQLAKYNLNRRDASMGGELDDEDDDGPDSDVAIRL